MTSKSAIAALSAAMGIAFLTAGCRVTPHARATPRNLLVICIDTARADAFSLDDSRGHHDTLTPWLDRAVRFSNAHAASSWTIPSVASALTGLYPSRHHGGLFAEEPANLSTMIPSPLPESVATVAEFLAARKYDRSADVVSPWLVPEYGLTQGIATLRSHSADDEAFRAVDGMLDHYRAPNSPRFFEYLHLMSAHEDYFGEIERLRREVAQLSASERQQIAARADSDICRSIDDERCIRWTVYHLSLRKIRTQLAALLQKMERDHLLERTVVLIFSDHGEEFEDHIQAETSQGNDPRGFYGAGHGHSLYEEILRVPLVFWAPQTPGREISAPVSVVDIAPSLLEWARIAAPSTMDGISFAVADRDLPEVDRIVKASGIAYGPQKLAAIRGSQKAIYLSKENKLMFFNIEEDRSERHPLERLPQRRVLAAAIRSSLAARATANAAILTPEQVEQLRSVGYLGSGRTLRAPDNAGTRHPDPATKSP